MSELRELQDTLSRRLRPRLDRFYDDYLVILKAARRVADPDIGAATKVLKMYEGPSHANEQIAREIVNAALGITEDH